MADSRHPTHAKFNSLTVPPSQHASRNSRLKHEPAGLVAGRGARSLTRLDRLAEGCRGVKGGEGSRREPSRSRGLAAGAVRWQRPLHHFVVPLPASRGRNWLFACCSIPDCLGAILASMPETPPARHPHPRAAAESAGDLCVEVWA